MNFGLVGLVFLFYIKLDKMERIRQKESNDVLILMGEMKQESALNILKIKMEISNLKERCSDE